MDRASIERESRSAEAALATARETGQAAAEAVEARVAAIQAEGGDLASDEQLPGLIDTENAAKGTIAQAQQNRDTLLKLLSRNPVAAAITVTSEPGDAVMSFAEIAATPDFSRAQMVVPSGSAIGTLPNYKINSRARLIRSLQGGGRGFFAVGEGATGEDLIALDQRLFPPVEIPRRQIRVIDLISVAATDSGNAVVWGKQTTRTDAAAPEALATAFPNATYTWTKETSDIENIGQYVKAPRETLLDIPAIQSIVENQLVYGVLNKLESLIYSGDGVSLDFTGIQTAALNGGYSYLRDTTNESRIIAIHKGITAVRESLFQEPDAIVMHPDDYHSLITERSSDFVSGGSGVFMLNASRQPGETPYLWGLPVVASTVATAGSAIVGNFKLGATLWVRSGAELLMSDSNEDDFLTRLITFRAEFRAAFAVQQPWAFCVVEDL